MLLTAIVLAQPSGYSFIQQFGKPCHLRSQDLPWSVFNSGPYPEVTGYVIEVYNAQARSLGLGSFFVLTTSSEEAQLTVDWSGRGLPRDKAAGVFWDANLGYKRVERLVMDGGHRVPKGNRAQILMQEFGHVLGLGDSSDSRDIMYPLMHRRRYRRMSQVRLTERDRAALAWLYRSPTWVPILGRGHRLQPPPKPSSPETPKPFYTPISLPARTKI